MKEILKIQSNSTVPELDLTRTFRVLDLAKSQPRNTKKSVNINQSTKVKVRRLSMMRISLAYDSINQTIFNVITIVESNIKVFPQSTRFIIIHYSLFIVHYFIIFISGLRMSHVFLSQYPHLFH